MMIASTPPTTTRAEEFHWLEWESYGAWIEANWQFAILQAGLILGAILLALLLHALVFGVLKRIASRTRWNIDNIFAMRLRRPARLLLPLLALLVMVPALTWLDDEASQWVRHLLALATIFAIARLLVACVRGLEESIRTSHDVTVADNLAARRIHTQITVLARTAIVFIVIIAVAAALMTFPRIREIGAGLLVSAGFAGLALGLAARPVLENLIAGIQIALTQPIRLDDQVIIDGEFGRVEEITSTYVVVRIWDDRRLIAPFAKFMTDSFENWTRRTAQLLSTVIIYADYSLPVERLRQEVQRIVESSNLWDQRTWNLQVTDATPEAMQLRILVSAANPGHAWDLRVKLREDVIAFLQREFPHCLPRTRVELGQTAAT